MQPLAKLRARIARLRENEEGAAADALELAEEALALTDVLRAECAAMHERALSVEAELRARDGQVRRLLDLVPLALVITDGAGNIVDVNRAAALLLGRSRTGLCDELFMHFFDDRAAFADLIRRLPDGDAAVRVALRVRPRERAPFDAQITLVRDPRGNDGQWLWYLSPANVLKTSRRMSAQPSAAPPPSHPDPH
jgi:PAS domain S-box-containing protein